MSRLSDLWNATKIQIVEGLKSLPLVGDLIPRQTNFEITDDQLKSWYDKAIANISLLTEKERDKLNNLINDLASYANIIGSPQLTDYINLRKKEIQSKINNMENKVSNLEDQKLQIEENYQEAKASSGLDRRSKDFKGYGIPVQTLRNTALNTEKIVNNLKGDN